MALRDSFFDRNDAPLILVIDDSEDAKRLLSRMLQTSGYRTLTADDGPTGISIAEKYSPNAILLDINMPDMDGYQVCEELKSRLHTADIPVLFVTGLESSNEVVTRCFDAGAHDLLFKPVEKVALLARLRVVLREQALRDAYRRLATKDHHTGLDNRRQCFLAIMDAVITAKRDHTESILILGNIDHVSEINTRFGFEFGDEVILTFARLSRRFISPYCKVGRIDGDTLAIVLKNTTQAQAMSVCQRVRQTFAAIAFDADTQPKHFTTGFGLACFDGSPEDFDADTFMLQADLALFKAKEIGQSRVAAYWDLDPDALPQMTSAKRHARGKGRKRTNRAFLAAPEHSSQPTPLAPAATPHDTECE